MDKGELEADQALRRRVEIRILQDEVHKKVQEHEGHRALHWLLEWQTNRPFSVSCDSILSADTTAPDIARRMAPDPVGLVRRY